MIKVVTILSMKKFGSRNCFDDSNNMVQAQKKWNEYRNNLDDSNTIFISIWMCHILRSGNTKTKWCLNASSLSVVTHFLSPSCLLIVPLIFHGFCFSTKKKSEEEEIFFFWTLLFAWKCALISGDVKGTYKRKLKHPNVASFHTLWTQKPQHCWGKTQNRTGCDQLLD